MRRSLLALLAAVPVSAPAGAAYYEFTGTIAILESSPGFLFQGVSVSGSGIGFSSRAPSNEIRSFAGVSGFTGAWTQTYFQPTAGFVFTTNLAITGIGDASFAAASIGTRGPVLLGELGVRGLFRHRKQPYHRDPTHTTTSFPLTVDQTAGLGLGGTVPNMGTANFSVRFGTWRTATVWEQLVITGMGNSGTISAMGFDARTDAGMGTVQLVTPVRTISGLVPIPAPGDRAAVVALTLHFAPEPGRGALLLAGSLALLGLARGRL
jgi:hypothetical protein